MVAQPSKVKQTLINQLGRLDNLVLNDDWVAFLRQRQRVDSSGMSRSRTKLRRNKPAVENDVEVLLNKPLELSFRLKSSMAHQYRAILNSAKQRHVLPKASFATGRWKKRIVLVFTQ